MKSVFSLLILLTVVQLAFSQCVPTTVLRQNNWRWRNNDGNETSATWKAPEKIPITYHSGILRLRVEILNLSRGNNGLAECPFRSVQPLDTLQYSTDTTNAGSWKNIGNDPSKAFRLAGTSALVVQNEVTTAQLNTSSNFNPGKMMVSDSVISNVTISPPFSYSIFRTEMEWAIVGTSNLLPNTTYYFRQGWNIYQYWNGSRYIYSTYPLLTTTASLPVKFTRFATTVEDKKAKLQWETASEQNNDRFEVQRSADQQTWQTLTTIKAKGNTNNATEYTVYDDKPIPGINYYRLQQFDKDRKSTLSEVRQLKMGADGSVPHFAVFPNPAHDAVRFINMGSSTENITANLSDASGKVIHRQFFGNVQSSSINTLSTAVPLPGLYLLQLTGNNTAETVKLIIR